MPAVTRVSRIRLRRVRHMDYQIVRNVSFQSLSFFGTIALLIAVAFNVGLFGIFGFLFISLLNPRDMIMTAFALVVFLVVFYGATMGFFTQATLAYELLTVMLRRRVVRRFLGHFIVAAGSMVLIAGFFVLFFRRVLTNGDADVPLWRMAILIVILACMVLSAGFVTSAQRRRTVLLGAVHLVSLVAFGIAFGATVASERQRIQSTIVLPDGKTISAGILLLTSEGVFYRTADGQGGYTSHYLPLPAVKEIQQ